MRAIKSPRTRWRQAVGLALVALLISGPWAFAADEAAQADGDGSQKPLPIATESLAPNPPQGAEVSQELPEDFLPPPADIAGPRSASAVTGPPPQAESLPPSDLSSVPQGGPASAQVVLTDKPRLVSNDSATGVQSAVDAQPAAEPESPISMDFKNTPIRDVLKILSQQSGLNFVTSKDAESVRISIYLDQVSVHDAMASIAEANDLIYEKKPGSNIYIVYSAAQKKSRVSPKDKEESKSSALPVATPSLPSLNQFGAALGLPSDLLGQVSGGNAMQRSEQVALETKVFFVRFKRLSSSPMDIGGKGVIDELGSVSSLGQQGGSSSSGGGGGAASIPIPGAASSEGSSAEATRGVDQVIAQLLSTNGKLATDLHTNALIVTDTADRLKVIEEVLRQIDVPARQVMLEVEIIEIKSTLLQDTGVDWGGDNGSLIDFTGGSRTASFPLQEALFNSFDATTGAKSSVTLGTMSFSNFKATLRFLMSNQDTKILARPRVLTLNNEAAIIKLATNTSIAKVSEQSSSEGVSVTTTDTAERSETGIVLKMTPQINLDDTVELYLEPSISTVAASTFFANDFLDPTVRSVRTTVRVKNHETLVIGGLIDTDSSTTVKKFPLFGDLPLIGEAFRYTDKSDSDRELLIFISPHILREGEEVSEAITSSEPRFFSNRKSGPKTNVTTKRTDVSAGSFAADLASTQGTGFPGAPSANLPPAAAPIRPSGTNSAAPSVLAQLGRDFADLRPPAPPLLPNQTGSVADGSES